MSSDLEQISRDIRPLDKLKMNAELLGTDTLQIIVNFSDAVTLARFSTVSKMLHAIVSRSMDTWYSHCVRDILGDVDPQYSSHSESKEPLLLSQRDLMEIDPYAI